MVKKIRNRQKSICLWDLEKKFKCLQKVAVGTVGKDEFISNHCKLLKCHFSKCVLSLFFKKYLLKKTSAAKTHTIAVVEHQI